MLGQVPGCEASSALEGGGKERAGRRNKGSVYQGVLRQGGRWSDKIVALSGAASAGLPGREPA